MDPYAHVHNHGQEHAYDGPAVHSDDSELAVQSADSDSAPGIEERNHFDKVVTAFTSYRTHAFGVTQRRRHDFHALLEHHKRLIPDFLAKLSAVDDAIRQNASVLKEIVVDTDMFMEGERKRNQDEAQPPGTDAIKSSNGKEGASTPHVSEFDMEKLRSTLKQFVRDWAEEGKVERDATYGPIMKELQSRYAHLSIEERGEIQVLVPGAGLGRLAFDIAKEGFSCQGNEFSFYMLLSSHFILNRMSRVRQYAIYPFIHSFSNIRRSADQLRPVMIPDVLPGDLPPGAAFSMVAGDFLDVYGQGKENFERWDVVVTCYFIDTAKNIMEYMEVIRRALKPGGVWINIGPLLYHFENSPGEFSIELSLEEVKDVACKLGFRFETESMVAATYTSNPDTMLRYQYECAYWTAVKEWSDSDAGIYYVHDVDDDEDEELEEGA